MRWLCPLKGGRRGHEGAQFDQPEPLDPEAVGFACAGTGAELDSSRGGYISTACRPTR